MSGDTYVIKSEAISKIAPKTKTHFLNQNASRIERSLAEATGLSEIDFAIMEVEPG